MCHNNVCLQIKHIDWLRLHIKFTYRRSHYFHCHSIFTFWKLHYLSKTTWYMYGRLQKKLCTLDASLREWFSDLRYWFSSLRDWFFKPFCHECSQHFPGEPAWCPQEPINVTTENPCEPASLNSSLFIICYTDSAVEVCSYTVLCLSSDWSWFTVIMPNRGY